MADGSQHGFNFPRLPASRLRAGEIVVDLFAGGGGASTALEQALGRPVDVAVNHNPWAVAMHAANHPLTAHLCQDVWEADPRIECSGQPVGWLHASPDCTHFSQAKGGQPRSRATRSLSWVVLRWAGTVRPRIISLENVREILKWGPLVAKRCKATGRVVKLDGSVAAPRERVPIDAQFLIPDKHRAGRTWRHFVRALHRLGYAVEWRLLKACDYGAGTSRERLFLVARRDGEPIQWPAPTHGPGAHVPHVSAAACIDWSIPCPSIFERKKPLADATLRRIARGVKRYVIDTAEPFIVGTAAPVVTEHANSSNARSWRADEPLRTQCAGVKGGHFALAAATLVQTGYGERDGQAPRSLDIDQPLGTVVAGGVKHALATASLVKFRGDSAGGAITEPLPTITSGAGAARPAGAAHALGVMTAFLEQAYGGGPNGNPAPARPADAPLSTITTSAAQQRVVTGELAQLAPEHEAGALRVAAFLVNYYGNGQALDPRDPLDTITTRDRLALVTVHVRGVPHVIVDIGLRMLKPRELYAAQGFPPRYIIDRTADGRAISVSRSVAMVGNSVSPPPLRAIAEANLDPAAEMVAVAA